MTASEESKILNHILERMDDSPQRGASETRMRRFGWLLAVVTPIVILQIIAGFGVRVFLVTLLVWFIGALTSSFLAWRRTMKAWPAVSPFIDAAAVRRRLEDLQPEVQ